MHARISIIIAGKGEPLTYLSYNIDAVQVFKFQAGINIGNINNILMRIQTQ